MTKNNSSAASVPHCSTPSTITYYEVGIYEQYERDTVLGLYRSKENADKHLQRLQAIGIG